MTSNVHLDTVSRRKLSPIETAYKDECLVSQVALLTEGKRTDHCSKHKYEPKSTCWLRSVIRRGKYSVPKLVFYREDCHNRPAFKGTNKERSNDISDLHEEHPKNQVDGHNL